MILYINNSDHRKQSFSAGHGPLDFKRCLLADMVIETTGSGFRIIKNRFGHDNIEVPLTSNREESDDAPKR